MNELAHHGTDHCHLTLAPLLQPFSPVLEERATPERRDGREVECFTQASIADLGEPRPPSDTAARLTLSGHQPGISCYLASAAVLCNVCDFREQQGGCCLGDAGDGVKQLVLSLQSRMIIDVCADQLFRAFALLAEVSEMFFDTLAHSVNWET